MGDSLTANRWGDGWGDGTEQWYRRRSNFLSGSGGRTSFRGVVQGSYACTMDGLLRLHNNWGTQHLVHIRPRSALSRHHQWQFGKHRPMELHSYVGVLWHRMVFS